MNDDSASSQGASEDDGHSLDGAKRSSRMGAVFLIRDGRLSKPKLWEVLQWWHSILTVLVVTQGHT